MKHINDKLQMLSHLLLGTTVLAGVTRYQCLGDFFAVLVIEGENVKGVHNVFTKSTNHESEVIDCVWYPAAFGNTPAEAFANLDQRLNQIVLSSATIAEWITKVAAVESLLCKASDNYSLVGCSFENAVKEH